MEIKKNEWFPFIVQGVNIGQVKRFYETKKVNRKIDVPGIGYLYREDISNIDEHYAISLDSEYTGAYVCILEYDKDIFERLLNSSFTRIVDYFVFARNIVKLYDYYKVDFNELTSYENKKGYSHERFYYQSKDESLSVFLEFILDLNRK